MTFRRMRSRRLSLVDDFFQGGAAVEREVPDYLDAFGNDDFLVLWENHLVENAAGNPHLRAFVVRPVKDETGDGVHHEAVDDFVRVVLEQRFRHFPPPFRERFGRFFPEAREVYPPDFFPAWIFLSGSVDFKFPIRSTDSGIHSSVREGHSSKYTPKLYIPAGN